MVGSMSGGDVRSPMPPRCQGDCDKDSDCDHGLYCFQRNGTNPVPGCEGGGLSDVADGDFCTGIYQDARGLCDVINLGIGDDV